MNWECQLDCVVNVPKTHPLYEVCEENCIEEIGRPAECGYVRIEAINEREIIILACDCDPDIVYNKILDCIVAHGPEVLDIRGFDGKVTLL